MENFFEAYDIITKTELVVEFGILTDEGLDELVATQGEAKGEFMRDTTDTMLDGSITSYAVANKGEDFPIIDWVKKEDLMNQIELIKAR